MSCEAVKWVLKHSQTRGSTRLVLLSIADHYGVNGQCSWPSIRTIASEAGVSRRTVFRCLEALTTEVEFIRRGGGRHSQSNHYRLKLLHAQASLGLTTGDKMAPDKIYTGDKRDANGCHGWHPKEVNPSKEREHPTQLLTPIPIPEKVRAARWRALTWRDRAASSA